MNTRDRYFHIDVLRATGILLMILTHVLSWHFGMPHMLEIWNAIHFVVVGLVFCSAYLYAKANTDTGIRHHFQWFLKRAIRLYIPFIIYLCAHYALWFLFPTWIRGYGIQKSFSFFISSITLTGGVDIGWLTTVFIQMAILFPFLLSFTRHKNNALFIGVLLFCGVTVFFRIPTAYTRAIAWIPWSLIAVFGFLYSDVESNNQKLLKKFVGKILFVSFMSYVLLYGTLTFINRPVLLTLHKYPPDLFYLSYGIVCTCMLILFFNHIQIVTTKIRRAITFVSRESYTLFFVHMVVLDATMTRMPSDWISETLIITSASLALTYTITKLNGLFRLKYV